MRGTADTEQANMVNTYSLDLAGVNYHDTDIGVNELAAQAVAEAADGGLGGAVDGAAGVGLAAGNGANVDDITGATIRTGEEGREDGLGDVDEAGDVGVEHDVDVVLGNLGSAVKATNKAARKRRSAPIANSYRHLLQRELGCSIRIVDENVNVFEIFRQLADKGAHLVGLADVELQREKLDAVADLLGDLGGNLLERVDAACGQDDAQVVLRRGEGEFERARLADAGGGAGDEDGLAGEALAGAGGDGGVGHVAEGNCGMDGSVLVREGADGDERSRLDGGGARGSAGCGGGCREEAESGGSELARARGEGEVADWLC